MGISLQVYRSRIGTFLPSQKVTSLKSSTTKVSRIYSGRVLTSIVCIIGLVFSILCLFLNLHISPNHGHHVLNQGRPGVVACLLPGVDTPNHYLDTPCRVTSKQRNFLAKIVNGNRGSWGPGIKLLHWNKGP